MIMKTIRTKDLSKIREYIYKSVSHSQTPHRKEKPNSYSLFFMQKMKSVVVVVIMHHHLQNHHNINYTPQKDRDPRPICFLQNPILYNHFPQNHGHSVHRTSQCARMRKSIIIEVKKVIWIGAQIIGQYIKPLLHFILVFSRSDSVFGLESWATIGQHLIKTISNLKSWQVLLSTNESKNFI